MKKILLSVLAVALTIVACNRYDDDFDALNQKLQDLEQKINTLEELRSQVTNLQTNVGALQGALAGVGSQVSGLTAFSNSVTSILGDISDLQAALDAASSDEEVAALKAELATTLDELSALVEANGAQLAQVLILVTENGDALDSVVASLAAVTTDLSSIKGSLVTMAATMDANKTAIIDALTEVMLADKTAILNAIGTSEEALAAAMSTNQEELVEAIADNKASTLAAVSSALQEILTSNSEGFASTVGSLTLSINNALEDILAGQSSTEASLQTYISTVASSNLAAITTAINDAVATLEGGQDSVVEDLVLELNANETAILNSIAESLEDILAGQAGQTTALTDLIQNEIAEVIEDLGAISLTLVDLGVDIDAVSALVTANQNELLGILAGLATAAQSDRIEAAVNAVLALQVTYTGDLYITNSAELEFATALGSKVEYLNGDLFVEVSASNGLDVADVNAVISQIKAVVSNTSDPASNNSQGDVARVSIVSDGANALTFSSLMNIAADVTIRTTGTSTVDLSSLVRVTGQVSIGATASHDLSSLETVTGDYYVSGHDIDDSSLATVGGNVTLNYDGGYDQPALETVTGGLYIIDYAAAAGDNADGNGTAFVRFPGLLSVSDFATMTSEDADVHHSGGGSSAGTSTSTTNAPTGGTPYTLVLRAATDVVIGEAAVVSVTANEATNIELRYSGVLASLSITATSDDASSSISVSASSVTGSTSIESGAETTISVTSDLADVTITEGLMVTLEGSITETATMNPAATATVTLSGDDIADLDVNSGATYSITSDLGTVDFVNAGSSVSITGEITGTSNFALATDGELTIQGDVAAINVTGDTASSVSITGNVLGAAVFSVAEEATLSVDGNLLNSLTATNGSVIAVSGTIADAVVIAPDADASVVLVGNLGSSLTITGDASSVTLEGTTVAGIVNVSIGDAGTFESSASYTLAVSISGGTSITLTGATAATDVSITGVDSEEGVVTIDNELNGALTINGADQVTYTGLAVDGVTTVSMNAVSGSFVASSLTTFGDEVTINAPSLSLGALTTISGLATFEKVESLLLPSLTSATSGIDAEMATIFRAIGFDTNGDIDLAAGASVTVKAINSMTHLVGSDTGSISISDQDVSLSTAGFTALTSFTASTAVTAGKLNYTFPSDNAALSSLTVNGTNGTLTVGTNDTDGLDALTTFTTSGSLEALKVFNAEALTSMNLGHSADEVNGIAMEISNNDVLTSFSSDVNMVYSFIVTENETLSSFSMPSLVVGSFMIPADVDNAVPANDIDFVFTVNDNFTATTGMFGTHQENNASFEESFTQSSLAGLKAYIDAISDAVCEDDGSTLRISMNYRDTATGAAVVGDTDISVTATVTCDNDDIAYYQTATGAGINTMDEVEGLQ
jgi:predicted  nucleic acid-binding Zn-ribbon protein